METDVVVAFLVKWTTDRTTRDEGRADTRTNQVLDAAVDRVWAVIASKLGAHPTLNRLHHEAATAGAVSAAVLDEAQRLLRSAAGQDTRFAAQLQAAVMQAARVGEQQPTPSVDNSGAFIGSVTTTGSVRIRQRVVTHARSHPIVYLTVAVVAAGLLSWGGYGLLNQATTPDLGDNGSAPAAQTSSGTSRTPIGTIPYQDSATSMTFSPDGRFIAVGSYNPGQVRLLDAERGTESNRLATVTSVRSVAFSPDGATLAIGLSGGALLWRPGAAQATTELFPSGITPPGAQLAFTPDGKNIAGLVSGTIRFWDVASGEETSNIAVDGQPHGSLLFDPTGRTFATYGGSTGEVSLWDTASLTKIALLSNDDYVNSAAFSPDGRTLAAGQGDGVVQLWDTTSLQGTASLAGHDQNVTSLAFAPSGGAMASAAQDGTIRVWETASWKQVESLPNYVELPLIAYRPDGRILATCVQGGNIALWEQDR